MLTLTPWSPFPGGHQRYWRHPDGRDAVTCRMYRINGVWHAYSMDPGGRSIPVIMWPGATAKQAKSNADIQLDRIRREWARGEGL